MAVGRTLRKLVLESPDDYLDGKQHDVLSRAVSVSAPALQRGGAQKKRRGGVCCWSSFPIPPFNSPRHFPGFPQRLVGLANGSAEIEAGRSKQKLELHTRGASVAPGCGARSPAGFDGANAESLIAHEGRIRKKRDGCLGK